MSSFSCRDDGRYAVLVENRPGAVSITISALKNSLMDPEIEISTAHWRGNLIVTLRPKEGERRSSDRGRIMESG
jgi:hypothetical protein